MSPMPELYVIKGVDGVRVAFGERQAKWLEDRGEITRCNEHPQLWHATKLGGYAIADLVTSTPELRECDFCTVLPTRWQVDLRQPVITGIGPGSGPIKRPVFLCDECAELFKAGESELLTGDRSRLVDHALATIVRVGNERGYPMPSVEQAMYALGPTVRGLVDRVYAARVRVRLQDG